MLATASATAVAVAVYDNDRNNEDPYPVIVDNVAETVVVHKYNLSFLKLEGLCAASILYYDS